MHFFVLSILACLSFVEKVNSSSDTRLSIERAPHVMHQEPIEQKVASPDKNQIVIPSQIAAALPILPAELQQLVSNYAWEWPLLQNMNFTAQYTFLSQDGLYLIMQRALYRLQDGKFMLSPKPSRFEKLKQKVSNYIHATSTTNRPSIILEVGKDEVEIEYIKNNVSLYDPISLPLLPGYKPKLAAVSEAGDCVITQSDNSFDIWNRDEHGIYQNEYTIPTKSRKINIAISTGKCMGAAGDSDLFIIRNINGNYKKFDFAVKNTTSIGLSRYGNLVIFGDNKGRLFIYKINIHGNQYLLHQKLEIAHPISAVAISPDQSYIAAVYSEAHKKAGEESLLTIWKRDENTNLYKELCHLMGDKKSIDSLLFSSDGKYLIALFKDKNEYTVKTWQVKEK